MPCQVTLEMLALRRLTTTAFGTLMSLEPAVALIVGLVGLHQTVAPGPVVGIHELSTKGTSSNIWTLATSL